MIIYFGVPGSIDPGHMPLLMAQIQPVVAANHTIFTQGLLDERESPASRAAPVGSRERGNLLIAASRGQLSPI